jgi:outer membrane receptor protein involved in Fe transport
VYGFDRWTLSRAFSVGYGAGYAKYDYITGGGLFSPRVSATVSPFSRLRIDALVSRRTIAPGAEEFVPPATGLWLPPERTFSPLNPAAGFQPETANHYEIALQHDLTKNVALGFRTFYQRVDDQIVTVFGARRPGLDVVDLGHYQVGSAGDYAARGWGVSFSHAIAGRLRGTVDYSVVRAAWLSPGDATALTVIAPSATIHHENERLHDLTTSVQAEIPETLTRVYVLYRINNGYARDEGLETRPGGDARFDVQVNQSLPFMNFVSTEWEMLVAVRNLFRDPMVDGSVYDELLVVRPPKRIVGGLMVRF